MREFEPTLLMQIDVFITQLLKSKGQVINMTTLCQRLGVDVIGRLAFGHPWNTQTEEPLRFIPDSMASITSRLNLFIQWPASHSFDGAGQVIFRKRIERFRKTLRQMIETRMGLPKDANYDLYSIFANDDFKGKMTPEDIQSSEVWAEGGIFLTAGKFYYMLSKLDPCHSI